MGAKSEHVAQQRLAEALDESVRLHMQADVPYGAFLSGGLDSSTVVALMAERSPAAVHTFAIGFEGGDAEGRSGSDELAYARQVADRFSTSHEEVRVGAYHMAELSESLVWHLDQPIADAASLANLLLAQHASRSVKMVLTGEGGDELFAGYARHSAERLAPLFGALPSTAKRSLQKGMHRLSGLRRPKIALDALCHSEPTRRMAA